MLETIDEPVEVEVLFGAIKIMPQRFWWQGREVLVKKMNLMHSTFAGRVKIFYFSVSDSTNYYKLEFNTEKLTWRLKEVYTD